MKKLLFGILITFILMTPRLFADVSVSIEDNFFSSANITIPVGTTVVWTNNGGTQHTVTSGNVPTPSGLFDSGDLNPGQTFSFTFNSPGTVPYFCQIHGAMGMVGMITVTCPTTTQLLKNGGFESGNVMWVASAAGIINNAKGFPPHTGKWKAQLNGLGKVNTESLSQQITVPSSACSVKLSFWLKIATTEPSPGQAHDVLKVQVQSTTGSVLKLLATFSNLNKTTGYVNHTYDLSSFKGKTIRIRFLGSENATLKTTFLVDDAALTITQ